VRPSEQLGLPGLEHRARRLRDDDPPWLAFEVPAEPEPPAPPAAPEGQLDLFDDLPLLRHDLEAALARADFDAARELLERLEITYGPAAARPYAFLERLQDGLWTLPPADAVAAWEEIADDVEPEPLQRSVRQAVLARLIAVHGAEALAAAVPASLPDLVQALQAEAGDGPAFALVRDALRAGRTLDPLAFEEPALRELLAEDLEPRWLACLGAIRRLWPVPGQGSTTLVDAASEDDDARADAFWHLLGVAQSPEAGEAERQDARRRLKRLHPELHAQHMGRRA
jgi:hypothetical protein